MNWTEFLKARVADVYGATEGLIDLVDDENLDPKTWCRFPILSGGFNRELRELRAQVEREEG